MKTKCIIVDDEPIARKIIRNHLSHFEDIEIVAECSNAIEAGKELRKQKIDLIFLDIEMPKISGFDFLSSLPNRPKVIIITAYRNYALKGYEFEILDYLLKPVSFDRFYQSISKYHKSNINTEIEIQYDPDITKGKRNFVYIHGDKTIHKIYLNEIFFIESFREYIKIHTRKISVLTKLPISQIEKKLKDKGFIRIHKSYIVSIPKIERFNSRSIYLFDKELPIGRTYKQKLMESLNYDPNLL
jgi:DNA-binding LytR/AlgR family response regulator